MAFLSKPENTYTMKTHTLIVIGALIAVHRFLPSRRRERRYRSIVRNPQYGGQRLPMRKWF